MERRSLTDMYSGRYVWLDIVKGFGILFVVVGHFCSNVYVYNWIYSFHMPLFFFASGYLYRETSIWPYVKYKFMTLMIPYFLFGIISQIFFAINEYIFSRSVRVNELVGGLLYGTYSSIVYNRVLWFLPALFCITNIYNVLNNVCGKKRWLLYIFVMILTSLYVTGIVPAICPWGIDNRVSNFMIYYMMGNIVAEKGWVESSQKLPVKYCVICAFLMISTNFALSHSRELKGIMEYLLSLIGIMGWVLISLSIERYGKALGQIGQASLCILCIHVPVGEVLTKILVRGTSMTFENCERDFLDVSVRCVLTVSICMACYFLIMRTVPQVLGKKNGNV